MGTKSYKPTTAGQRGLVLIDRSSLYKGDPCKSLVKGLSSSGGRNAKGRITVHHHGGGHKRAYRLVDFKRSKLDLIASVERLEYDPNRTAFIALINYSDGTKSYILAPQRMAVGDKVVSSSLVDVKPGNASSLAAIPVGTVVHNVELKPGKGGQLARSAGSYVQLVGREGSKAFLKMPSGELRTVLSSCWATIGAVSNPDNFNQNFGKAGRSRWMGIRPTVRGVAMNPVDHPHGGGEGRTSGGRHPCTPWGKLTRGVRTRSNKTTNKYIIRRRG